MNTRVLKTYQSSRSFLELSLRAVTIFTFLNYHTSVSRYNSLIFWAIQTFSLYEKFKVELNKNLKLNNFKGNIFEASLSGFCTT